MRFDVTFFKKGGRGCGLTGRLREFFWRTNATGSACLFESALSVFTRLATGCLLAGFWGKEYDGVVLHVTGLRGPGKEVASDKTVRRETRGGHGKVDLQTGTGPEISCY